MARSRELPNAERAAGTGRRLFRAAERRGQALMTEPLAPQTPCFLINLVERQEFNGRVVEVVAGPMFLPDETADWWYSIRADWLSAEFPSAPLVLSARHQLVPITPPDFAHPSRGRIAERHGK